MNELENTQSESEKSTKQSSDAYGSDAAQRLLAIVTGQPIPPEVQERMNRERLRKTTSGFIQHTVLPLLENAFEFHDRNEVARMYSSTNRIAFYNEARDITAEITATLESERAPQHFIDTTIEWGADPAEYDPDTKSIYRNVEHIAEHAQIDNGPLTIASYHIDFWEGKHIPLGDQDMYFKSAIFVPGINMEKEPRAGQLHVDQYPDGAMSITGYMGEEVETRRPEVKEIEQMNALLAGATWLETRE